MTFTLVPVTGTYLNGATPRTGTVRLQLKGALYNQGSVADRQPRVLTLNSQGSVSTQFVATNDPDTLPVGGGVVEVTETLSGLAPAVYLIAIPYNGGPVNLNSAPRIAQEDAPAPATVFQPVNERGLPGGYASLDGSGRVSRDQLPADLGGGGGGGGVEISGQATDIQPLGSRAAGSTGLAADAGHVHENPALHQLKAPTAAVSAGGQKITNLANGEQPQDAATVAQLSQSVLGWINVKDKAYGAKGDGTTDDTAALQAALDACPPGGTVYIPEGLYRVSAPIRPHPTRTLLGPRADMMAGLGLMDSVCYLQPLPSFVGKAVILLQDQETGGYASLPAEHRIENLMVDGSTLDGTNPVDGLYAEGNIQNVRMTNVTFRRMSNNGIVTAGKANFYPYSWRMQNVMVDKCRANGMLLTRMTDLTMLDCQAIGNWGHGMVLSNIANSLMSLCRSEWNGNYGIRLTGAWGNGTGSGGMLMSACSTDRNGWDGVRVDATGSAPFTITGLKTRRDGRNGGGGGGSYAGLAIAAATVPVVADAISCYPGVDDNGTGTASPQFGIYLTGASVVQIGSSSYLHAIEDGLRDATVGGSVVIGPDVTTRTGPTTSAAARLRRYTRDTIITVNNLLGETPFFIAHRGSGMEYPEHTMAGYESSIAGGAKAIEVSVQVTADGVPVCLHDGTLDRTTNATGPIGNWTYQALRNKVRTNAQPLLGPGWIEQEIPTLREVLDRYLGRVVIFLEAKSNASVPIVQKMITDFYPHAHRSLVWKNHWQATSFPWAKANNLTTWAYLDAGTTDPQIAGMSTVPDIWGVPHTMANSRIEQIVARGLPVICWEVHRRSDVKRLTALNVRGMMCAQMQYVRGTAPLGTAVDWETAVKAPGDMGTPVYSNSRALKYKDNGSVYFDATGAAALIGSRSRLVFPANGYRIAWQMLYEGLPPSGEHAGIAFGKVDDDAYQFSVAPTSGGYHVVMRASGQMQIYAHAAGTTTGTPLATETTAAVVAGQWMSFELDLTPTQIILRRTDVDPVVVATSTNTDFRGGYVHLTAGNIGSLANRPNWKGLSITPL
ncbi:glycerophosphodiester phosphodiesterase family protein [Streptomyces sp. NPDC018055]|uniref:glycerophosphodiester phosphodiesterase family protein n=1 Tax=Streptomyces sp. NPDC018055 TaxID=3365038 RepID=UPI0037A35895